MNKQILKSKLKAQLKSLTWRAITTIILVFVAIATVWVYAAFTEPLAGPNDSDQDFAQNILGNNDANNDFSSSLVAANSDGSIIERQEYTQTQMGTYTDATTTPSAAASLFAGVKYIEGNMAKATICGNSVIEAGEGCDDGGTSWTSGACAGDCSRTNYWATPSVGSLTLLYGADDLNRWCQEHGFNTYSEEVNTSTGTYNDADWALVAGSYQWTVSSQTGYVTSIYCKD